MAALDLGVVLEAHVREHRHLAAAQACHSPVAGDREPGLPGSEVRSSGHEELAGFVPGVHAVHAKPRSRCEGCPASTPLTGDSLTRHAWRCHWLRTFEDGATDIAPGGFIDEELQEALLHLAFYSGWPNGMGATSVLKGMVEDQD